MPAMLTPPLLLSLAVPPPLLLLARPSIAVFLPAPPPLQAASEACGYLPPTILTSSKSGKGRNELLSHVAQLRDFYNKTRHGM
jgi:hypothetical protein